MLGKDISSEKKIILPPNFLQVETMLIFLWSIIEHSPNYDKQNCLFCKLKLLLEKLGHFRIVNPRKLLLNLQSFIKPNKPFNPLSPPFLAIRYFYDPM